MRHSALLEAASRLQFALCKAEVERASVQRLFAGVAEPQNEETLDTLATFASLAAASGGAPENIELIDDIAHAVCDAYDLISRPSAEKRWVAELVSNLFITIGQIPKAATVSRAYRNARPAVRAIGVHDTDLSTVAEYAQSALSALNSDNLRLVDSIGGQIRGAVGKIITGDEARFAFVLSELLLGLADLLTADKPNVTTAQIEARIDLVVIMARDLEHSRLHQLSRRIAVSSKRLIESGSNLLLRKPGMLPSAMRAAFVGAVAADPAFTLWPSQIHALQNGALTANDHIVSEPTSAGKTLIAELKIAKFLAANPTGLAVYVAPYNALAAQVARNMSGRFRAANLEDAQLWTGTYEINVKALATTNILVTTPEKLDAIIRASKQEDDFAQALTSRIGLFVLDEFHLIGGANSRAITYELLITRLKAAFLDAQFLAMSAVADNAEDIGRWLSGRANTATIDKWTPTRRRILIYKRDGTLVDRNGNVVHELARWHTQKQAATRG